MKKLCLVALAAVLLSGSGIAAGEKTVTIGVSNCADTDTFTKMIADTLQKMIREKQPNWQATFVGAEMDPSVQLGQIESFIAGQADYIVMSSSDTMGCIPCVEAAKAAGIPLIDYVNPIGAPGGDFIYVGGSNIECGKQIGNYAVENLPPNAGVVIMEGQPGHTNGEQRVEGIKAILAEKRPDVKILASRTANWHREDGMTLMEDWIQAFGGENIHAVLAVNDQMAMGAVEAAKANGLDGKMLIVGVDGTRDAWEYIRQGSMTMSLFYNHIRQATNTYNVLVNLVETGATTHPDVISEFEIVDKSNVRNYIDQYYGK